MWGFLLLIIAWHLSAAEAQEGMCGRCRDTLGGMLSGHETYSFKCERGLETRQIFGGGSFSKSCLFTPTSAFM